MKLNDDLMKILEVFLPELKKGEYVVYEEKILDFPLWLRSAVHVYILKVSDKPYIHLIKPKADSTFDSLLNIYRQVSSRMGKHTILIANQLNPKFRPLLVKFRIPFIYKNKTLFAPDLGLVVSDLNQYQYEHQINKIPKGPHKETILHPLAIKIISGFLTKQIIEPFSLQFLYNLLSKKGVSFSLSKLSLILKELVDLGFITVVGKGPSKLFKFKEPKEVWNKLESNPISTFFKMLLVHHFPKKISDSLFAGESALAEYSDLTNPKQITIAVSKDTFQKLKEQYADSDIYDEKGIYIQVWNEDPELFCIDKKINPIELYLSLKNMDDERIQKACEQMLKFYDLTPFKEGP